MRTSRKALVAIATVGACLFLVTAGLMGQVNPIFPDPGVAAGGAGNANLWTPERLGYFVAYILGAITSGAVLAYHPHYLRRVASLLEVDHPKIIITYSVVGTLVALIVHASPHMGFAIFGVGGLMRFRTELQSAKETGRVILATVIGFCWGLEYWEIAIAATVIAWLLILILDWRVAYRMVVRGVDVNGGGLAASSTAYQAVLEQHSCQISQIKKSPRKGQLSIVFKSSRKYDREDFEAAFEEGVDVALRGTVDWPEEG